MARHRGAGLEAAGYVLNRFGRWELPAGVPRPAPGVVFELGKTTVGPTSARLKANVRSRGIIAREKLILAQKGMQFQFQLGLPSQQTQTGQLPPLSRTPGTLSTIALEIADRLAKRFLGPPSPALAAHSGSQAGEPVGDVFGFPDVIEGMIKGTLPRGARQILVGPNGLPECPQGFHFHKGHQRWCVHNRRMNPLNPRALSKAGRRIGGFARAVKRARTIKRVCKSL